MPTELQNLLTSCLTDNPGSERELADKFGVAVATVKRWAYGVARPHPLIAQEIIKYLKSRFQTG